MSVYGIDEAGRGPILGPMVLAAVAVTPAGAAGLSILGVKDSKAFKSDAAGKAARARIAAVICGDRSSPEADGGAQRRYTTPEDIRAVWRIVTAQEIDSAVTAGEGGLNRLEREVADQLLRQLGADVESARDVLIYADGASLFRPMQADWPNLVAVDKGESVHVAVAAASIVAKHYRDVAMDEIAQKYQPEFGDLATKGGGYLNAATRRFLTAYRAVYGQLPPETRLSWRTTI